VPFRVGEEVLVEIVEPHMYDATTRSPRSTLHHLRARRRRLVGQKLMVRIEEVGRTARSRRRSMRRRGPAEENRR